MVGAFQTMKPPHGPLQRIVLGHPFIKVPRGLHPREPVVILDLGGTLHVHLEKRFHHIRLNSLLRLLLHILIEKHLGGRDVGGARAVEDECIGIGQSHG